jgi:outer membrane lipoprotein-sorting protein
MSISGWRNRRSMAWLAPLAVAGAVAGGTVVATAGPPTGMPALSNPSARHLIAQVLAHAASPTPLSGTVHESAALGLPSLPGEADSASLSWQQLLTGNHDVRVWIDGPTRQRIAVLGQLSEAEVVHSGTDLWTYTSATNTATHTVLPANSRAEVRTPAARFTPAGLATEALKAITPSTDVSVESATRVAGRSAYSLVLRPSDSRSTIRRVVLSVDSTTFAPVRVRIFGAASAPAFDVGFSHVQFSRPNASVFNYSVPRGARVTRTPMGGMPSGSSRADAPGSTKVLGTGWTSVLEMSGSGGLQSVLPSQLSTPIAGSADRLVQTALVNAVLRPDGTVLVGAVRPALLERLAATAH